ncbi:MAG TPA: hypothetical protein VFP66_14835 [Candidatus Limnocylindrales bacterium]|nr:hypothetical protein [Candidatus Limnocylindrales bacterium]
MDSGRGTSHEYVQVKRPEKDGARLVRRSDGFHWARPTTDLSDDICALCGYGPAEVRGRGKHTAKLAVEVIA